MGSQWNPEKGALREEIINPDIALVRDPKASTPFILKEYKALTRTPAPILSVTSFRLRAMLQTYPH